MSKSYQSQGMLMCVDKSRSGAKFFFCKLVIPNSLNCELCKYE